MIFPGKMGILVGVKDGQSGLSGSLPPGHTKALEGGSLDGCVDRGRLYQYSHRWAVGVFVLSTFSFLVLAAPFPFLLMLVAFCSVPTLVLQEFSAFRSRASCSHCFAE